MIKLERTSVMNLENAMRGARNPMNSSLEKKAVSSSTLSG